MTVPLTYPAVAAVAEAAYHAGPGVSKSKLWTLLSRTPLHAHAGEQKETEGQKFGSAAHCAVLEPGAFESRYMRGPADRRGNKWGAALEIAAASNRSLVTESDYDDALRLRDVLHRDPLVQRLTAGVPAIEMSAYAVDPETQELCRCRPDLYNYTDRVMVDLKCTADASAGTWWRRVKQFGYYVQDPWYCDTWEAAGGGQVDAFVFLVVEDAAPFAHKVYDLAPRLVQRGRDEARKALRMWRDCRAAGLWPGYSTAVETIDLPDWEYGVDGRD